MPTIPALPAHANPLDGTEEFAISQAGITSKASLSELTTSFDTPSEQVDFVEVAGVAATAMRSDGAPALSPQLLLPLGFGDFQLETETDGVGTSSPGSITLRAGDNAVHSGSRLELVNASSGADGDANVIAGRDITLQTGSGNIQAINASLNILTVGRGIGIAEGSDAKSGVATLSGGTATVNTTAVTGSSRIQLTAQNLGTITVPVGLAVSARSGGTSFTILSGNALDTSDVAWLIIDPV